MNPGIVFTEKYLKLMFKQLRDATPEEVQEELEHCRRENRRPVRIPRYFRGFFTEEKFAASTGFEMQVFRHDHASHKLILYLHGGAFIYPPVFFHWRFLHDLALRTHCDALLPVYPKSPEYDCEYSVQTVLSFYRSISKSGQYNEIHLVGDSLNAIWQGKLPAKHPWVSPVFGDFSGVDNLNVYYGSDEILQPDDLFLKETYEKAGKTGHFQEFEGMFHTFVMFPIPQGFKATREIAATIKKGQLQ